MDIVFSLNVKDNNIWLSWNIIIKKLQYFVNQNAHVYIKQ